MRSIRGSAARFLVAGAVNTGVTYIAYILLLQVFSYRIAFSIAFMFGIAFSYLLSARFVFRRPASWYSLRRFPLIYVAQYLLGLLVVSLGVDWLGIATWLAPLVALAVTIPFTYFLSRALFEGKRAS